MDKNTTIDESNELIDYISRGIVSQAPIGWEKITLNASKNEEDSLDFVAIAKVVDKNLSFGITGDVVLCIVRLRKMMETSQDKGKWNNMELKVDKSGKFDIKYGY